MPIYLYCLARAGNDPPAGVSGLDGLAVRGHTVGSLVAWVSEMAPGALAATVERARAHDSVVRRAMELGAPVPARFGQRFPDEAALARGVMEHHAELLSALERVRGAVEMTVRIAIGPRAPEVERGEVDERRAAGGGPSLAGTSSLAGSPSSAKDPSSAEGPTGAGRAYLERLRTGHEGARAVAAAARDAAATVERAVADLVRESAPLSLNARGVAATLAHLVAEERVSGYRARMQKFLEQRPELSIRVSGPWAPYSFARIQVG